LARRVGDDLEQLTNGPLLSDSVSQRQVPLDVVAIATAISALDDVSSCGEVVHDPESTALSDVQLGGDVAQTAGRVTGDAHQGTRVFGEKAPFLHHQSL
jgi:hypothetical protein